MRKIAEMEKVVCIILAVGIFCYIPIYSKEARERRAIYVNIFPLFVGHLNVCSELAISDKMSLVVGFGYMRGILAFAALYPDPRLITTFYKVGLGFYQPRRQLRGFYVLPVITLCRVLCQMSGGEMHLSTISIESGHKWISRNGVMFDLSIDGGLVTQFDVKNSIPSELVSVLPVPTHVGVQFGYAW